MTRQRSFVGVVTVLLGLAACGDDDGGQRASVGDAVTAVGGEPLTAASARGVGAACP